MLRYKIFIYSIILACGSLLTSCSTDKVDDFLRSVVKAPPASIEYNGKGHSQIYAVSAVLRMGFKGGNIKVGNFGADNSIDNTYSQDSYNMISVNTDAVGNYPLMQQIEISKGDDGQMQITSERDHFDVVASNDVYYGLELTYYGANHQIINGEFIQFYYNKNGTPDYENSTLVQHQHFFTIGNEVLRHRYSIDGKTIKSDSKQGFYPHTLGKDPVFYTDFTFEKDGDKLKQCDITTTNAVPGPLDGDASKSVPYDTTLMAKAVNDFSSLKDNTAEWNGHRFYQAISVPHAAEKASELFKYEYRDTDPFEHQLGYEYQEGSGDGGVVTDGTNTLRQRQGDFVELLHQMRKIGTGNSNFLDRMGFKGVMQFKQANTEFALQVSLCNIVSQQAAEGKNSKITIWPKYGNEDPEANVKAPEIAGSIHQGAETGLYNFNQIKSEWSNHDIDIPLTFRVIADMNDGEDKFVQDFSKYYPKMGTDLIKKYFFSKDYLISRNRKNIFVM